MSGAQIALQKLGVKVEKCFASEIDKQAIKVSQANFPDTIHLGDVTKITGEDLGHIDLLIGGSPCQGFSFAGKGLNFDDERSKLFFEFVRIKNELQAINPDLIFLLENVRMKKEHELVISHYLGVFPIQINSSLVSAQNRVRNYWTNINAEPFNLFGDLRSTIKQPKDKKILLKDILQPAEGIDAKYYLTGSTLERILKNEPRIDPDKSYAVKTNNNSSGLGGKRDATLIKIDVNGTPKSKQNKTPCLTAGGHSAGNHSDMDLIYQRAPGNNGGGIRTQNGKTPSMTSSDWKENNYLIEKTVKQLNPSKESSGNQPYQQNRIYGADGIAPALNTDERSPIVIEPFLSEPTHKHGDERYYTNKAPTIQARYGTGGDNIPYVNNIRRLTPIECCRLQTVPDDIFYDADGKRIVSDSAIYRMLGNGFTCDVIAHILSFRF
jgi:DNA (cytosine-5)-methyltransferase 3A